MDKIKEAQIKEVEEELEIFKAITFTEQRKVLRAITDEKYKRFFLFCCCTGARVCEALTIRHKDIDFEKKVIRIRLPDTKTKKHRREIPFIAELFDNMKLYKTSNRLLFENITDEGSKQYFYKLYKKLNMDLSRHSARHTFVSVCGHIGIKPEQIQKWAGHTNLKMTTDTYTHILEKGSSPVLTYLRALKKQLKQAEKADKEKTKALKQL